MSRKAGLPDLGCSLLSRTCDSGVRVDHSGRLAACSLNVARSRSTRFASTELAYPLVSTCTDIAYFSEVASRLRPDMGCGDSYLLNGDQLIRPDGWESVDPV